MLFKLKINIETVNIRYFECYWKGDCGEVWVGGFVFFLFRSFFLDISNFVIFVELYFYGGNIVFI